MFPVHHVFVAPTTTSPLSEEGVLLKMHTERFSRPIILFLENNFNCNYLGLGRTNTTIHRHPSIHPSIHDLHVTTYILRLPTLEYLSTEV